MENQTNKILPNLRFPEFENDREWEEKKLEEVCEINPKVSELPEQFVYIDLECVENGTLLQRKIIKSEGAPSRAQRLLNENDIIFQMVRPYQKNNYYFLKKDDYEYVSSTGYAQLRSFESSPYLYQFIHTDIFVGNVLNKCTGSNYPAINSSDLSQISVLIPKIKEQQKIAACLTSLDEVITAHSQKLDALKEHKKGLMQNLFPQEGENVPKWRFPEFVNDGEWAQTIVEKNCLVKGRIGYRGYTTEDLVGQGEGALVLGGKHIQNQLLELKDPTYLSWEKYYESPEIMVEVGDIIFSQRGTLGDCAIIDREIGQATINPSMVLLKNITCDAKFLYYILIGDRIQIEVRKNRATGAIPMLSQKQIKEFPFLIPGNLKEQQKTASFISSLDALIMAQVEKIEQLKSHKKGLMQGLFPKTND